MRVGLIGCGHISETHLRAWSRISSADLYGAFDLNAELAESRKRKFGIERLYGDMDELIGACDVVDVCTPPHTHARIAKAVVAAGRHLIIEKPLVVDVADWDQLREMLTSSASTISVVHNLKFLSSVQVAKNWVDSGKIGDVLRLHRLFLTSAERDRMLVGDKHWSHALPGGRWLETLPHELYLIYHFIGPLELASVVGIRTASATSATPADEVVVTLKNEKAIAIIEYSANCQVNRRSMTLHGSTGSIDLDLLSDAVYTTAVHDRKWKRSIGMSYMQAGRALSRMLPDRLGYVSRRLRSRTPHSTMIETAAKHIRGEGPPPTPVEEIDYVVRNCDLIGREIERQMSEHTAQK